MATIYDSVETTARDLYIRALKRIPPDVRRALSSSLRAEQAEGNRTAERVMLTILENIQTADSLDTIVCQDTGLPMFKVRVGSGAPVDIVRLKERLRRGCERATAEYPLRSNTVHPLTRKHTGTNTGEGIPVITLDFVPGSDRIEICLAPKGSGSENTSFLKMLNPADGRKGVKQFVLQCIFDSGARPCPPMIVGVGLGGTSDVAMHLAKDASTFRQVGRSIPTLMSGSSSGSCSMRSTRRELAHRVWAEQRQRWRSTLNGRTRISVRIRWPSTSNAGAASARLRASRRTEP